MEGLTVAECKPSDMWLLGAVIYFFDPKHALEPVDFQLQVSYQHRVVIIAEVELYKLILRISVELDL